MRRALCFFVGLVLMSGFDGIASAMDAAARGRILDSHRVGADVVAALDNTDDARVMIAFRATMPRDASRAARRAAIATARSRVIGAMGPSDFSLRRSFDAIEAVAGDITSAGLLRLLDDPSVVRIDLDGGGSAHLAEAVPLVQLNAVHGLGYTGAGVTVAVIDSGIDTDHPDLSDSLVDQHCFCSGGGGCCPGGGATASGAGSAEDDNGHGTNVSGIVTANGTVAPLGGAPDADVIAVKVLDASNSFCCSSDVIAALDWVSSNHPDTDVVNMSLGTFALYPGDCDGADAVTMAYAAAVDALTANGTIVFASSGNQASGTAMAAPACVANTMSVGAVWDSDIGGPITILGCTDTTTAVDAVTCFSNSDVSTDLFAPGAPITSTGIGGGTSTYFGTSQASPLSAACAATLRQVDPTLTPAQLEMALKSSTTSVTDATNGLSFPRLNCLQALETVASPCPATPQSGCRAASKSLLLLKNSSDAQDKLIWKWIKGASTSQSELGDPTVAGTNYSLCLYSGLGEALAAHVTVPGGSTGWATVGSSGYRYLEPTRTVAGIQQILLKGHADAKSKIIVKGKGANLPDPDLSSIAAPVRVQLRKSDDPLLCFEALFDAGDVIANDGSQLKARHSD